LLICLFLSIRMLKIIRGNKEKSFLKDMDSAFFMLVGSMVTVLVVFMSAVTGMCTMNLFFVH
jgi:hypothetical protein